MSGMLVGKKVAVAIRRFSKRLLDLYCCGCIVSGD